MIRNSGHIDDVLPSMIVLPDVLYPAGVSMSIDRHLGHKVSWADVKALKSNGFDMKSSLV